MNDKNQIPESFWEELEEIYKLPNPFDFKIKRTES